MVVGLVWGGGVRSGGCQALIEIAGTGGGENVRERCWLPTGLYIIPGANPQES